MVDEELRVLMTVVITFATGACNGSVEEHCCARDWYERRQRLVLRTCFGRGQEVRSEKGGNLMNGRDVIRNNFYLYQSFLQRRTYFSTTVLKWVRWDFELIAVRRSFDCFRVRQVKAQAYKYYWINLWDSKIVEISALDFDSIDYFLKSIRWNCVQVFIKCNSWYDRGMKPYGCWS